MGEDGIGGEKISEAVNESNIKIEATLTSEDRKEAKTNYRRQKPGTDKC